MEETLQHDEFISLHRNQVNTVLFPKSTLTFAINEYHYEKLAR